MPKRLIYAEDAIDAAAIPPEWDGMYIQDLNGRIREAIEQLPSAQPERKGQWIECDHEKWVIGVHALRCSECNGGYHLNNEMTIYYWNYCPNCGAKMEVEDEQ